MGQGAGGCTTLPLGPLSRGKQQQAYLVLSCIVHTLWQAKLGAYT